MEITAAGVRTWRNGSGAVQDEPLRNWTSSVTGRTFIVEWRLFIPVLNAWVTARPINDNQEAWLFNTSDVNPRSRPFFSFWDGATRLFDETGRQVGIGMTEYFNLSSPRIRPPSSRRPPKFISRSPHSTPSSSYPAISTRHGNDSTKIAELSPYTGGHTRIYGRPRGASTRSGSRNGSDASSAAVPRGVGVGMGVEMVEMAKLPPLVTMAMAARRRFRARYDTDRET